MAIIAFLKVLNQVITDSPWTQLSAVDGIQLLICMRLGKLSSAGQCKALSVAAKKSPCVFEERYM
jgi:hypothetical protein